MWRVLLTFLTLSFWISTAMATTYHVATDGSGDFTTIAQVNAATFSPGDSILFRRGDTWRERITFQGGSGSSTDNILTSDTSNYITYGAYGTGDKPKILGSVTKNNTSDWVEESANIWKCASLAYSTTGAELLPNPSFDTDSSYWLTYFNSGDGAAGSGARTTTAGEYDSAPAGYKLTCTTNGSSQSSIQLYTRPWSITEGVWYELSFKAKATEAFTIALIQMMKKDSPYTNYSSNYVSDTSPDITTSFTEYKIRFKANTTADDCRMTFYLGNAIPDGATLYIDTLSFKATDYDDTNEVSNSTQLILDNENSWGWQVYTKALLTDQRKFWWDSSTFDLYMYSVGNPATVYNGSIECALRDYSAYKHTMESYLIIENIDFRYCGACVLGGSDLHHTIIRDCDFRWIGGTYQTGSTRFGNAVQFWANNHDNLVERNYFYQIYDAAMTDQTNVEDSVQYNQYWKNNITVKAYYAYEFWYRPESSTIHDVYFENNTCYDGESFGHESRGDATSKTICLYAATASISNIFIRNNIFYGAPTYLLYVHSSALPVTFDNNSYYTTGGNFAYYKGTIYTLAEFATYQSVSGEDANSITGDPLFISTTDFHLQSTSPCKDVGTILSEVTDDFEGNPRPMGASTDMGCYEWYKCKISNATLKNCDI